MLKTYQTTTATTKICCHLNVAARAGRVPLKEVFKE
jgi:hypothetical protein